MTKEFYSDDVRHLFENPSHAASGAEDMVAVEIDGQGVSIGLAAALDDGRITSLRFRARGCPHLIAAAEYFCRNFEDRAIPEIAAFNAHDLMQTLAVPATKTGRILVLEDAVKALGQALDDGTAKTKD